MKEQYLSCYYDENKNKFYLNIPSGLKYNVGCNSLEEMCFSIDLPVSIKTKYFIKLLKQLGRNVCPLIKRKKRDDFRAFLSFSASVALYTSSIDYLSKIS